MRVGTAAVADVDDDDDDDDGAGQASWCASGQDRNINLRIFTSKVLSIARTVEKSDGANEGALDQCIQDFFTALRDLEFEGVRLCRITEALKHDKSSIEARFKVR